MHKFSTARNRSSRCPRARARTRDGTPSGPGAFFLRRSLSLTMSNSSSDTGGTTAAAASGGASEGAILGGSNGPGSGNRVPITRSSSPLSIAEAPTSSWGASGVCGTNTAGQNSRNYPLNPSVLPHRTTRRADGVR
ncbi:hypothetical protein ACJJTC_005008 [Scirpophaga incertulas]